MLHMPCAGRRQQLIWHFYISTCSMDRQLCADNGHALRLVAALISFRHRYNKSSLGCAPPMNSRVSMGAWCRAATWRRSWRRWSSEKAW